MPEATAEPQLEIQVRVLRFIHEGSGLFKIALVSIDGLHRTAMGDFFKTDLNETMTLRGQWEPSRKAGYEPSFHFSMVVREIPANGAQIEKFLKKTKGVGDVTARKIVEACGGNFRQMIAEPASILQKVKVSEQLLQAIREDWFSKFELRELELILGQIGMANLAGRVRNEFGPRAAEIISENPYRLISVTGIGFRKADELALIQGTQVDDIFRIEAAVNDALHREGDEGHSFTYQTDLLSETQKLAAVKVGKTKTLYPLTEIQEAIDQMVERGDIIRKTLTINEKASELCYLPEIYHYEVEASERIAAMQSYPHTPPRDLEGTLLRVERDEKINLSKEQRQAVLDALKHNLSILTGKPGTGKTTSTKALIHLAEELGLNVGLMAPTGRAAKRLSEITGKEAKTIHRTLRSRGAAPENGEEDLSQVVYDENNPLPFDLVLLDESSMLDLRLLVMVLRALPVTCSLVLIGDEHQLPSIGAGTVLKDLIGSKKINTVVLSKIFRQAEGSLIIQNAHRINRGEMPQFPARGDKQGDSFLIDVPKVMGEYNKLVDDPKFVHEKIASVYHRLHEMGFDLIRDVQILVPMKKGDVGYQKLNEVAQKIVNPHGINIELGRNVFRLGDRIMQVVNDYKLNVYNGDVGVIRSFNEEDATLNIQWSDRCMEYPAAATKNLRMAYATSIHRFQGSECPVVILVLTTHHQIMLNRNLVYTANTRAKRLLVYIASKQAIHTAVENQSATARNSLLAPRIRQQLKSRQDAAERKSEAVLV